jgi:hypothetical protein
MLRPGAGFSRHVLRQRPDLQDRFLKQLVPMTGRHLGDDLGRELGGLTKALQGRAPREVAPV